MKLIVDCTDLLPEYIDIMGDAKVEHFKPEVQILIQLVPRVEFYHSHVYAFDLKELEDLPIEAVP